MHQLPDGTLYRSILVAVLIVSFGFWVRMARRDRRLIGVYLGALLGGFTGAKIVYLFAEGWLHVGEPGMWLTLASGKSIVGALLGGYLGIEIAKASVGYQKATGDWFALVVPLGIAAGRIGCLSVGCCLGIPLQPEAWWTSLDLSGTPRWPAPMTELLFNLVAFSILLTFQRHRVLPGQLFHLYLIGYGIFRFFHEFLRATEKPFGGVSGYQVAALGLIALGWIRFIQRRRHSRSLLSVEDR